MSIRSTNVTIQRQNKRIVIIHTVQYHLLKTIHIESNYIFVSYQLLKQQQQKYIKKIYKMSADHENGEKAECERLLSNAPSPHIYGSKQAVCWIVVEFFWRSRIYQTAKKILHFPHVTALAQTNPPTHTHSHTHLAPTNSLEYTLWMRKRLVFQFPSLFRTCFALYLSPSRDHCEVNILSHRLW